MCVCSQSYPRILPHKILLKHYDKTANLGGFSKREGYVLIEQIPTALWKAAVMTELQGKKRKQSTWRMLNEGRLPAHLQVERIGRLWYVILPDEEPALLTVGYARVSSHERKPQLEPQANRLWAYAGQNGIKLDRVVSEVASGLNDRRPKLRRLLADPKVGTILVEHRDRQARIVSVRGIPYCRLSPGHAGSTRWPFVGGRGPGGRC